MSEQDLMKKHEEFKQLVISSYHPEKEEYKKQGYSFLYEHKNHATGFYGMVLRKGNDVVIVFRGTDKKSVEDFNNDVDMCRQKLPAQSQDAMDLYVRATQYCKNNNLTLTVTGHSLGGSLAQMIGAITGVNSVTFNAFGTKNILPEYIKIYSNNITNYCTKNDYVVARSNAKNHIGKCFVVPSTKNTISHKAEYMASLKERNEVPASQLSLSVPVKNRYIPIKDNVSKTYNAVKTYAKELSEHYGRNVILMPGLYSGNNQTECTGSYPVSGYERKDGTKVEGYIRECFKHGIPQSKSPREKYKGLKLNQLNKTQLNELLDDLL